MDYLIRLISISYSLGLRKKNMHQPFSRWSHYNWILYNIIIQGKPDQDTTQLTAEMAQTSITWSPGFLGDRGL